MLNCTKPRLLCSKSHVKVDVKTVKKATGNDNPLSSRNQHYQLSPQPSHHIVKEVTGFNG